MTPNLPGKSWADRGQNGDIGIRAATGGSFGHERCFDYPSPEACETLCSRPRDTLDHLSLLLRPARHRHRNCNLAPAVLLGRDGHRLDASVVSTANSFLKKVGADGLQLCAARPKRMEPGTAL